MPSKSGYSLERAQEDYEKGLKVEQDFAEYFTGRLHMSCLCTCVRTYTVCVLGLLIVCVLSGHA